MITQAQIKQFQAISPNALPAYMMPNYQTIKEMLDITTDANDLNELGVGEDFDVFFTAYQKTVAAPKMTTSSTAVKQKATSQKSTATKASNQPKAAKAKGNTDAAKRAAAKTPTGNKTNAQKVLDKAELQKKATELYEIVKQNAKLKNQIGEELTTYLQNNVVRLGLGSMPIDYEIEKLKAKVKFYTNLLKNDKEDFKAIARRLGLSFRDMGANVQATLKKKGIVVKSAPARTAKQKESDAWGWVK